MLDFVSVIQLLSPSDKGLAARIVHHVRFDALGIGSILCFRQGVRTYVDSAGPLLPSDAAGDLQISSLSMNCNGSLVSAVATVPSSGGHYDSRLFVYSSELNGPLMFHFAKDLQAPRAAHWDLNDPRLLTVQVVPLTQSQSRPNSGRPGNKTTAVTNSSALGAAVGSVDNSLSATCAVAPSRGLLVAIMFVSPEAGVLLQEYQDLEQAGASGFLGVAAPHLLVHKKALVGPPNLPSYSSNITRVPMLGFSGLENADAPTRQALLDFNYCLAIGKLEEAFRAVAALKIPAIWNSMAHMAIKNKRLDVAGAAADPAELALASSTELSDSIESR